MDDDSLTVDLSDDRTPRKGKLVVARLPRGSGFYRRSDGTNALVESGLYRYEIDGIEHDVTLEPSELFEPDDLSGRRGRLRPGQSVGRMVIAVQAADGPQLRATIDVAPAKLEQEREYRQMLEDVAEHAVEAVLQGFAPTALDLTPSNATTNLMYQRFAVLEALLRSEDFEAAVNRILHQPDRGWNFESELRSASASYPSGSAFRRAMAAPGRRQPWLDGPRSLKTIPHHLALARHTETLDTSANRFVKYALERWRAIAVELLDVLGCENEQATAGPIRRGRAAAQSVVARLDELLSQPAFVEVSRLTALPMSNQVLLKREGYRQILRMFALVETGVSLALHPQGIEDVFSASQRNVATLYEFWCYLTLTEAVGRVCGKVKTASAFAPDGDGLSLTLRTGRSSGICWGVKRNGRALEVELYFNRHFSTVRGTGSGDGSWTRAMRPDCSLRVRPVSALPRQASDNLDIWVHFDAKYRVERLTDQTIPQSGGSEGVLAARSEEAESHSRSRREDLLKMHAYRDAIHRTAGAYILYPGDEPVRMERFNEILPGLGAFPLRPGPDGDARGLEDLEAFVDNVLTHIGQQASRHERSRFWDSRIHVGDVAAPEGLSPAPFLDLPPADTEVLLGYVRSPEHWRWINRTKSYNVRADRRAGSVELTSPELRAELLLLYSDNSDDLVVGSLAQIDSWRAATRDELLTSGYPRPGGSIYFVAAHEAVETPPWLNRANIRSLLPHNHLKGSPVVVTWWDLMRSTNKFC